MIFILKNITALKSRVPFTYLKILLYIIVSMHLIVGIFSIALYYNFEKVGLHFTYQTNKRILAQLTESLDSMHENVKNLCLSQFFEADNIKLMNATENDLFQSQRILAKLQNNISGIAMVQSAAFYNNNTKQFYYTNNGISSTDNIFSLYKKDGKSTPPLTPIPRILPKNTAPDEPAVLTYIMYDSIDSTETPNGALMINIKTDWLLSNLKKFCLKDSNFIIIDKSGSVIADGNDSSILFKPLKRDYIPQIVGHQDTEMTIVTNVNHERKVVTYCSIPNTGWLLINEQSYHFFYKSVSAVKKQTVLITIVFSFFSFLLSAFIARNIYTPFGNLVQQVKKSFIENFQGNALTHDAEYLSEVFQLSANKLKDYEYYKKTTQTILRENYLKAVLMENEFTKTLEFKENQKYYAELFNPHGVIYVILYKVDNTFDTSGANEDGSAKNALAFNMIEGNLDLYCKGETISIEEGEFAAIINPSSAQISNMKDNIAASINEIKNTLGLSLSAFLSDKIENISLLNRSFKELRNLCRYRLIFGKGCILDISALRRQMNGTAFIYPSDLECRIIEEMKLVNLIHVNEAYLSFMKDISNNNIDNFILALIRLATAIQYSVQQINLNRINNIDFDFNTFSNTLIQCETSEQINSIFSDLFRRILEQLKIDTENKHSVIVNSIKDYIKYEYSDMNLSLKKLSSEFKRSPSYIGKLFKDSENKSVSDYMNDVRMEKALQLLKNTSSSVKEIMNSVGYDNESNFYRLFRKYYGITPKEYRMALLIQEKDRAN